MDLNVHPSIEEKMHAKPIKKKNPCKAKDVTVPGNHCSKLNHGDIGFLPPIPNSGGNEVFAKPVRKRAPRKKKLEISHDSQCLETPLQESCGFTGTPKNMDLPNLNKLASARMSPKNTSILRKPSVAKMIHKANVGKEGGFMFQGLGSLLTVLCKSAQGDIASISVDSIASNAVSNALLIGPTSGCGNTQTPKDQD